jgi:hypothetical protein
MILSLRKEVIIIEDPKNDWLQNSFRMERHNIVFFHGSLILTREGRLKK